MKSGAKITLTINELLHIIKHTFLSGEKVSTPSKEVADYLMLICKNNIMPAPQGIDADLYKALTLLYQAINNNNGSALPSQSN